MIKENNPTEITFKTSLRPSLPHPSRLILYRACDAKVLYGVTHEACVLATKTTRRRKMADVLDVDVEDKGGFSEDEGDGKNFTS